MYSMKAQEVIFTSSLRFTFVLYLMVTGVKSIMVVTLSRNADRMAAMRHRMMIMGQTRPLENWYACQEARQHKTSPILEKMSFLRTRV